MLLQLSPLAALALAAAPLPPAGAPANAYGAPSIGDGPFVAADSVELNDPIWAPRIAAMVDSAIPPLVAGCSELDPGEDPVAAGALAAALYRAMAVRTNPLVTERAAALSTALGAALEGDDDPTTSEGVARTAGALEAGLAMLRSGGDDALAVAAAGRTIALGGKLDDAAIDATPAGFALTAAQLAAELDDRELASVAVELAGGIGRLGRQRGSAQATLLDYAALAEAGGMLGDDALIEALEERHSRLRGNIALHGAVAENSEGKLAHPFKFDAHYPAEACYAYVRFVDAMWRATGDARFADEFERVLYNAVLRSVGIGDAFEPNIGSMLFGAPATDAVADACSVAPMLALPELLPKLVCATRGREVLMGLYATSRTAMNIGGSRVVLEHDTGFPCTTNLDDTIRIEAERPTSFALKIRIPRWAPEGYSVILNREGDEKPYAFHLNFGTINERLQPREEERVPYGEVGGKLRFEHDGALGMWMILDREWGPADTLQIKMALPILRKEVPGDPVIDGRVAVTRGPLLMALISDGDELVLPPEAGFIAKPPLEAGGAYGLLAKGVPRAPGLLAAETHLPFLPYGWVPGPAPALWILERTDAER